jgi:hypothetical protein
MPCSDVAHRVQPDPELRTVLAKRLDLGPGHGIRDRQLDALRGHVVILGGDGEIRPAHRARGHPQPVERLRAGHFVHQMQIDVQQVGFGAAAWPHHVRLPHLLSECVPHLVSPSTFPDAGLLRYREYSIGTWDSIAVSGFWTRRWPCYRWSPRSRAGWPSSARRPACRARRHTGWPSDSRCIACYAADPTALAARRRACRTGGRRHGSAARRGQRGVAATTRPHR